MPAPPRLHRYPALRLADVEPANATAAGSCRAKWDPSVPVRCGPDKTRNLIYRTGARGQSDLTSWPSRDANNASATTAVVELFQSNTTGELRLSCSPRWLRRDRSPPQSPRLTPVVLSAVLGQVAGPLNNGEAPIAWSRNTAELLQPTEGDPATKTLTSTSFTNAFPANASSSTAYNRFLPRIITCSITADDPANGGLPVYAFGVYLAVANSSAPFGIGLVDNYAIS